MGALESGVFRSEFLLNRYKSMQLSQALVRFNSMDKERLNEIRYPSDIKYS